MANEEAPTLEYSIPAPETYLPSTPLWFWWVLTAGVIVIIALLVWLWWLLKPKVKSDKIFERDLFKPAMKSLDELKESAAERLVSEVAAEASLIIRTYLAGSQSEPALYETTEEFQARQSVLPADANAFLNELSDAKYTKSKVDEARASKLVEESQACLQQLQSLPKESPAKLEETPAKRHFSDHILMAVPLGLMVAIAAFLFITYKTDQLVVNLTSWIALGLSAVAFLAHFILRPRI